MTPLMHRNDGHITIQGVPYAGETVYLDDAELFIRSRGEGYTFDPPCWRYNGTVHYQTARIIYTRLSIINST